MIIKTFTEPQDIIIIGNYIKKNNEYWGDFLITDDYQSIGVYVGTKWYNLETDGFVNILTRDEFDKQRGDFEEVHEKFFLLPNFKGDITLATLIDKDGQGENTVVTEFDLDKYLHDQRPEDWEDFMMIDTRLHLPEGTKIVKINGEGRFDDEKEHFVWKDLENYKATMIPVIDKKNVYEPSYRMTTAEYIRFIEKNSDMDWNTVCDWIFKKGYLDHEDMYNDGTQTEAHKAPNADRIADHGVDYEYEFYQAHPFLAKRGVVFFFDD